MKQIERLGEAMAPDGTVLTLYRHDGDYSIRVAGVELMSTRRFHSEEQLAEVACQRLRNRDAQRVLIGGLGLGFTLKAALRTVAADAEVVVAEIVGEIIEWNRTPEWGLSADALADPRVRLRHADVAEVLRESPGAFDAIMLDVDNGAEALTTDRNAALYRAAGIRLAASALRPGGRVVYWSADDDPAFEALLRKAGFTVHSVRSRAHRTCTYRHTLLVGDLPATG